MGATRPGGKNAYGLADKYTLNGAAAVVGVMEWGVCSNRIAKSTGG